MSMITGGGDVRVWPQPPQPQPRNGKRRFPSAFVMGRRRISPEALERFMQGLPPVPATTPRMRELDPAGAHLPVLLD